MMLRSISQNALLLGVFAAATAGLIALTFQGTQQRIETAQRQAAQRALLEVIPPERHNNDLLNSVVALSPAQQQALGVGPQALVHIARQDGQPVALILPAVAPDGYSGDIRMIVGVNMDGSVAGVRVLQHRETPGLGDKLDLNISDWILTFDGRTLGNPPLPQWAVRRDGGVFDQFTGATITPRAVVRQVRHVLEFFEQEHRALLQAAQEQSPSDPETAAHEQR